MAIQVDSLCKGFKQGNNHIDVLRSLDLEVSDGEKLAILGKSGSGKSTLISMLAGLDSPDSGTITVGGVNLQSLKQKELSLFRGSHIGIVFQHYHLIESLTVFENVLLPLQIQGKGEQLNAAKEILEQVELSHRLQHFPRQLSGGEKQRVAVARAMVTRPQFLLADEPSGSLDVETGASVMKMLFDVVEKYNMTLILVTHDVQLAKKCQRSLQLVAGKLSPVR